MLDDVAPAISCGCPDYFNSRVFRCQLKSTLFKLSYSWADFCSRHRIGSPHFTDYNNSTLWYRRPASYLVLFSSSVILLHITSRERSCHWFHDIQDPHRIPRVSRLQLENQCRKKPADRPTPSYHIDFRRIRLVNICCPTCANYIVSAPRIPFSFWTYRNGLCKEPCRLLFKFWSFDYIHVTQGISTTVVLIRIEMGLATQRFNETPRTFTGIHFAGFKSRSGEHELPGRYRSEGHLPDSSEMRVIQSVS